MEVGALSTSAPSFFALQATTRTLTSSHIAPGADVESADNSTRSRPQAKRGSTWSTGVASRSITLRTSISMLSWIHLTNLTPLSAITYVEGPMSTLMAPTRALTEATAALPASAQPSKPLTSQRNSQTRRSFAGCPIRQPFASSLPLHAPSPHRQQSWTQTFLSPRSWTYPF